MSNTGLTIEQISIHALREEGDSSYRTGCSGNTDFYPRPPRGGRPTRAAATGSTEPISIHALREEGDRPVVEVVFDLIRFLSTPSARRATRTRNCTLPKRKQFLSTPSARRATKFATKSIRIPKISIHALREEGDIKLHWM